MKKRNEKNKDNLLLLFLYIQPFLDVITSFQTHFQSFITIGVIIRILFLCLVLLFSIKEKPKKIIYYFIYCMYIILDIYFIWINKSPNILYYEIKNFFHILYFPLMIYGLHILNPQEISNKHFVRICFIYLLFLVIPGITNTSFEGYKEGKTGIIGWFYATNEISAILCIFMPFIFHYILKEKGNLIFKIILTLSFLYATLNLGSKMPVIIFMLLTIIYGIDYLKKLIKKKKFKKLGLLSSLIIIFITAFCFIIPKTSIYYNMKLHLNFLEINSIQDIFKNDKFVNHFIFSERLTFLKNTHQNYQNASLTEKLFGIGFIENYNQPNENRKTIEMDYFDIFYRTGIIGTLLFIYPTFEILKQKKRWNKTNLLSILIALFIAGFAGHVIIAPAVSIYLVIFLLNSKEQEQCS